MMYIMCHNRFEVPQDRNMVPLEVGAVLRDPNLGYLKDCTGDNISEKNPNYCELTGLYWVWKNTCDEYVGICHYRRYFSRLSLDPSEKYYYSMSELENFLKAGYDVVVPKRNFWMSHNVETGYYKVGEGRKKDLEVIRSIISEKYPAYLDDYEYVLKRRSAFYCNMMVSRKELYDRYCSWLFDILFEAERMIDLSDYSREEARVFGYLSEILLNVWVRHQHLKVKYLPVAVNRPASVIRRVFIALEKLPVLGRVSNILLCVDLKRLI